MSLVRLQDTISVYKKISWILYTSSGKVPAEIEKRIACSIEKIEILGGESDKRCERYTLKTAKHCWEKLKTWANSRREWRTEEPGVLQSMESQSRVWLSSWATTNKWRDTVSWVRRLNTVVSSPWNDLNIWCSPVKIPVGFFVKCDKVVLKFIWKIPQFSSVALWCPTLHPMNRSMPGLPVHHQLPEFTQTHAHRVGDAIQPSHPLLSPSPPAPNLSQHQGLFQWVNSSHEVATVLEFQLQHQSFQGTSRTDLL